jgi:ketosteroid isomerase-like protein
MSQENVKKIRETFEAWNRGDRDAAFKWLDNDVVLRTAEGWPERAHHGKLAARSFYEGFAETVGGNAVIEDLIDAGEIVVARIRAHMTGERSGLEGDMQFSQVQTFRKGKVVLIEFFWDHHEALEAAGVSE